MALQNALQGATHTGQLITWSRSDGTAQDLTGATLTGTITNVVSGVTVSIAGTLTIVTAASGIFSWTYAAADVTTAGQYRVQFTATYSGSPDLTFLADWLILPIPTSARPRPTMSHLIARLRKLLADDTTFSDFDLLELLDDHSVVVDSYLEPQPPFFTEHVAPFENLELAAKVYVGYNTLLTVDVDYTADYQRGIFTTSAADYRGLKLLGKAYDVNAAAADGWDRIASRSASAFDWSDVEGSYKPSQARDYASSQASRFRARAWARSRTIERHDTASLAPADWRGDLLARAKAGY